MEPQNHPKSLRFHHLIGLSNEFKGLFLSIEALERIISERILLKNSQCESLHKSSHNILCSIRQFNGTDERYNRLIPQMEERLSNIDKEIEHKRYISLKEK